MITSYLKVCITDFNTYNRNNFVFMHFRILVQQLLQSDLNMYEKSLQYECTSFVAFDMQFPFCITEHKSIFLGDKLLIVI